MASTSSAVTVPISTSGLALPLYLPAPAALIVAGSVLAACLAALWLLENAKNRASA